ncbi:hypothetical protein BOTBODRAFT_525745 [Botryobasidium botryosum FD-172 SS1]|uniref:Uncharacterized protein n=1 Tax=Botryobasidium botryosum (strain FD-172 SS1) TaxID=930990 RepID=A0A067M1X4_BOTB1|nr:hypothetical protein BOTBODRAFT_525745 [Botryobasidium botryosum FD-172 SS1]
MRYTRVAWRLDQRSAPENPRMFFSHRILDILHLRFAVLKAQRWSLGLLVTYTIIDRLSASSLCLLTIPCWIHCSLTITTRSNKRLRQSTENHENADLHERVDRDLHICSHRFPTSGMGSIGDSCVIQSVRRSRIQYRLGFQIPDSRFRAPSSDAHCPPLTNA